MRQRWNSARAAPAAAQRIEAAIRRRTMASSREGPRPGWLLVLFPRRTTIVDLVTPPLPPCISQECIPIQCCLVEHALGLEEVGPAAHHVQAEEPPADRLGIDVVAVEIVGVHRAR